MSSLSTKAWAFLKEKHFAILSTINRDGSPQLTTMWYILDDDGSIVMNTQIHLQKAKNIHRDSRIAICVQDGPRYVTIRGAVAIIDDQIHIQQDLRNLIDRYIEGEINKQQYYKTFTGQQRISLRLASEKVTEYLA
ncbi:pyridoxamine 5'-phosphate oxidase family protein [Ktedonospora formicarum]|nr:TIGR03618 family F420-dependent PPOX class oxidoreductase [Ktedonospora formicarum]